MPTIEVTMMAEAYPGRGDRANWPADPPCGQCQLIRDYRALLATVAADLTAWRAEIDPAGDARAARNPVHLDPRTDPRCPQHGDRRAAQ